MRHDRATSWCGFSAAYVLLVSVAGHSDIPDWAKGAAERGWWLRQNLCHLTTALRVSSIVVPATYHGPPTE
jgi:hypothetical protein